MQKKPWPRAGSFVARAPLYWPSSAVDIVFATRFEWSDMNKRLKTAALLALLLAGAVQPVIACRFLPQRISAEEQVARATDVALVKVVRATPRPHPPPPRPPDTPAWMVPYQGWNPALWQSTPPDRGDEHYLVQYPVEYEFVVEKRWRGTDRKIFTLMGVSPPTTFADPGPQANQGLEAFWEPGGGRFGRLHFCTIEPWFVVGERYLVFVGKPVIARSYEHIATIEGRANPDDRWLRYVDAALGAGDQAGAHD